MIVRSCEDTEIRNGYLFQRNQGIILQIQAKCGMKNRGDDGIVFNICHNYMFCCELFNDAGH
jgi:hypothetical protein